MLTFLLIAAAVQLASAYGCFSARDFKSGTATFWFCGFLSLLFSPLLVLQFLALMTVGLISGLLCRALKARPRYYLHAGAAATLAIFLAFGLQGPSYWTALQQHYPMESVESRLAYEVRASQAPAPDGDVLAADAVAQLDHLYDQPREKYARQRRAESLAIVHGSYVTQFVNSPGFGVGRDIGSSSRMIETSFREAAGKLQGPVPMPAETARTIEISAQDAGSQAREQTPRPAAPVIIPQLETVHRHAQLDFADPLDFGFVLDRAARGRFSLASFHAPADPARIVGDRLPDDRVVGGAPGRTCEPAQARAADGVSLQEPAANGRFTRRAVRPLDAFEEEGLSALRAGETIHTRDEGDRIRMLGAVRAAGQCLNCHEVQHGALLGAFSYEFGFRRPAAPAQVNK